MFTDPNQDVATIPLKKRGAFMRWRKIKLTPMKDRFWPRVQVGSESECWPYMSERNKAGYGVFNPGPKSARILAHRMAWKLTFGEIPDGKSICHKCDNPPCCNPAHFFVGTHLENMQDAAKKGRINPLYGENNPQHKLNEQQVREIKIIRSTTDMPFRKIALLYGVCDRTVRKIVNGKKWKHVQ